jgi:tRNA (guanine10-N2)-methyltransferase
VQEFEAVANLYGVGDGLEWMNVSNCDWNDSVTNNDKSNNKNRTSFEPIRVVKLPSDEAAEKIVKRTSLVKFIAHLWGYGTNDEELRKSVFEGRDEHFLSESMTYKLTCSDFGRTKSNSAEEIRKRLENLVPDAFQPKAKVDLMNPKVEFLSCEVSSNEQIDLGFIGVKKYFGRVVAKDQSRARLNLLDLKKRRYLGPTSMDAHMSLIMCNMVNADEKRYGMILDPFCGTGSVLLTAAELGCLTCGFEIDPRVLEFGKICKKTGEKIDVLTNFEDYGFQKPVFLIRGDVHKSPLLKGRIHQIEGMFQGIVADPPYGVRERGRKSQFGGRQKKTEEDMKNHFDKLQEGKFATSEHIPSTVNYPLSEIMDDLIDLSAKTLPVGGRMCFFLPADVHQANPETDFPSHPCFKVVAHSLQNFSTAWGRRLVTYEKTKPFDIEEHLETISQRELARNLDTKNGVKDLTERVREFVFEDERSAVRKEFKRDNVQKFKLERESGIVVDREKVIERRERAKALRVKDIALRNRGKRT